jgi:hypothetical protein
VQVRNDESIILCDRAERFEGLEEEMNRKQHRVCITLHLSGDDTRAISNDKMRVQDIYKCIRSKPGRDRYELFIEHGEWKARVEPDNATMLYTPEVHKELEGILKGLGVIEAMVVDR